MSSFESTDKKIVVLITGCSSGIGLSTAEEFAKYPDRFIVWATMRKPDQSSLYSHPSYGQSLFITTMDVTSEESVQQAVSTILSSTSGKIDVVINNAGYGLVGCLETVHVHEAQQLFDTNVWGVVRVLQAVLPSMRAQRFGHVINISSTSGIRGIPCFDFYTGSKFALEGISDSLRYSLAPFNISVTVVEPGPVRTKFADRLVAVPAAALKKPEESIASSESTGESSSSQKQPEGGRGTRVLPAEDISGQYYHRYTDTLIAKLNERMDSPTEGQLSEEVGQVIVSLVEKKLAVHAASGDLKEIPFNIGPAPSSQAVLDGLRVYPNGWGGLYSTYLQSVPPLEKLVPEVANNI